MKSQRGRGFAINLAIGLLATACTTISQNGGPPTVIKSTPFGSTVISQGGQPVSPGSSLASPPANLGSDSPAPIPGGGRDGSYSGTAVPLNTGGGVCIQNQTISDFDVKGDTVRWGRFRGRIQNDGLQMVHGDTWVFGQFEGNRFNGQISSSRPRGGGLGCSFMMTLERTGT